MLAAAVVASIAAAAHRPIGVVAVAAASAAVVLAVDRRARLWMVLVVFVVGGVVTARATAGPTAAMEPDGAGTFVGWALVAEPPVSWGRSTRSVLEIDGQRFEVRSWGAARDDVDTVWQRGTRLHVTGVRVPHPVSTTSRVGRGATVGSFELEQVAAVAPSAPLHRSTDVVRELVGRGAARLDGDAPVLFRGFVLGDRTGQDRAVVERYRRSGLSHLLVVSGLNVALVLALVAPVASRMRRGPRTLLVLAVLGWFVVLTRAEPSVVRAATMAALAVTARLGGHDRAPFRLLCVAVVVVMVVDPSFARSIGWWLSIGATAGVCTLGPWLAARLALPGWLAAPVGITLGAQAGVALPAWLTFGSIPVVGVVANVLAVPVASFAKLYGLPAAIIAGAIETWSPQAAEAVMWPVGPAITWVDVVARTAASFEVGPAASAVAWSAVVALTLAGLRGATTSGADGHPPPDR